MTCIRYCVWQKISQKTINETPESDDHVLVNLNQDKIDRKACVEKKFTQSTHQHY